MQIMKINNMNNFSFQKRLIANCAVLKEKQPEACKIYKMGAQDQDYFKNLFKEESWQDAYYLESIDAMMKYRTLGGRQIYSMEDSNDNCIAFCEVDHECIDSDILEFIEVAPKIASSNGKRKTKYVGETLMSFLMKYALQNGKQMLAVDSPSERAEDFYLKNCGMSERTILNRKDFVINEKGINKLLDKNLSHTGSKIEIKGAQWYI